MRRRARIVVVGAGIGGLAAGRRVAGMRLRGRHLRARCRSRRGRRRAAARTQRGQGAACARHRARAAAACLRADQHRVGRRRRRPPAFSRAAQGGLDGAIRRALSHRPSRRRASAAAGATAGERDPPRQALHRHRVGRRRGGRDVLRRARGRSRHRGRCRWHQFGGAGKPVRGPGSPLHRANGLALHRADRLRPDQDRRRRIGRDRPRRIRGLDRPRWSRHLLSDPRRRALQHLRRPRFRAMDRGIVVGAEQRLPSSSPATAAGTRRCWRCSATSSSATSGAFATAIRCPAGRAAASRCSATPLIR